MTTIFTCPACEEKLCEIVELIPGYAIDPKYDSDYLFVAGQRPCLEAKDIKIVFTAKCPDCGHCEKLCGEQQTRLQSCPPPGYESWQAYWVCDKKVLPRQWLETLLRRD